jgi:hypothetical protein
MKAQGTVAEISLPMLGTRHLAFIFIALFLLVAANTSPAQTYSINWYKIGGGGGTSTNGQYSVSGTIGQHDAGGPMTNGVYSLTGGYWAMFAIQTLGAPLLTITHGAGNSVVVSWPSPSTGYVLQQNPNLVNSNGWANYSGATNVSSGTNSVTITPPAGTLYFRLRQ